MRGRDQTCSVCYDWRTWARTRSCGRGAKKRSERCSSDIAPTSHSGLQFDALCEIRHDKDEIAVEEMDSEIYQVSCRITDWAPDTLSCPHLAFIYLFSSVSSLPVLLYSGCTNTKPTRPLVILPPRPLTHIFVRLREPRRRPRPQNERWHPKSHECWRGGLEDGILLEEATAWRAVTGFRRVSPSF